MKTCTPHRLPLQKLDWISLISLIGQAREAVGRFDEVLKKIPEPALEILKWEEAIASLRAQRIEATLAEVLSFALEREGEEKRTSLLQKILHAYEGLTFSVNWAKKHPFLNLPFYCRLHSIIKRNAPNPKEIGALRERQNWIGPYGCKIEEAYFYPPPAKKVKTYLQMLNRYGQKREKEPLVQIAIFFAQFLIIHPFMDGNGRMGRILIPLFLTKKQLLSKPYLFLSSYFEKRRLLYSQKLFYISEKEAWEEWIAYFLKGVIEQAQIGKEKCEILYRLFCKTKKAVGEKEALHLFSQPVRKEKSPLLLKKELLTERRPGLYFFEPLLAL